MADERDELLNRTAALVAATATAVAPLIAKLDQRPGQFGGTIHLPTHQQIADALLRDAEELLASLPTDSPTLGESRRLVRGESR